MGDRSPSIVPSNAERDIYLVLEDFGHTGRAWRETDEADTDRALSSSTCLRVSTPTLCASFPAEKPSK